jgi:hypothetical protein
MGIVNRIWRLAMWIMRSRSLPFALLIAFSAGCFAVSRFPAVSTVAGQSITTTVDSELARFYLEHHLRGDGSDSALAQVIDKSLREVKPDLPTNLFAIAQRCSFPSRGLRPLLRFSSRCCRQARHPAE